MIAVSDCLCYDQAMKILLIILVSLMACAQDEQAEDSGTFLMDQVECSTYIIEVFESAEEPILLDTQSSIDQLCGELTWREHLIRLRLAGP